jgi:hypothetical protein
MPKFKTERIILDGATKGELDFKIDVYVNEAGLFTATIPEHIAKLFKDCGIKLKTNGRSNGRPGYYESPNFKDLILTIEHDCKEYVSREMIRETIVIRYMVETTCSYAINENKEIVPNGYYVKEPYRSQQGDHIWREGTVSQNATWPQPFGLRLFCRPFYRRDYRYRSGKEVTEYHHVSYNDIERKDQPNLHWLASIAGMSKPEHAEMNEIEYTEKNAHFFVNFVKAICSLNEKLKQFIEPDMLALLIDNNPNLLGNP